VAELAGSPAFRSAVLAWWQDNRPDELVPAAAEPVQAAAAALLAGDPGAADAVAAAGRRLDAGEAERHGLVARVVSHDKLEETLADITRAVSEAPARALRLAKRTLDRAQEAERAAALAAEIEAIEQQLAEGGGLDKR